MAEEESTLDTIRDLKRRDPYAPFNIVMAGGDRYVIEDSDALAIGTTQLHYYPRTGMGIHLRFNQITVVEAVADRPA